MQNWLKNIAESTTKNPVQVVDKLVTEVQEAIRKMIGLLNEKAKKHKIIQEKILHLQINLQELRKELVKNARFSSTSELQALVSRKNSTQDELNEYKALDNEMIKSIRQYEKLMKATKTEFDKIKSKQAQIADVLQKSNDLENALKNAKIDLEVLDEVYTEIHASNLFNNSSATAQTSSEAESKTKRINLEKTLENDDNYLKDKGLFVQEFFQTQIPKTKANLIDDFFNNTQETNQIENFFDENNNFCINIDSFLQKTTKEQIIQDFFSESENKVLEEIEKVVQNNYENSNNDLQKKFDEFFNSPKISSEKQKQIDDFFKDT
ncbi:MAG: hypothetical protein RMJ97_11360 [Raineya sp.]|nr:hypothetical protein [Raineya sp.]MDW8297468.1 hypothetical protein [Raineya sp.]